MQRPALRDTTISVVLPVFNEQRVLVELHARVHDVVDATGALQEIIFVNDGSRDATAQVLDDLAAVHPEVRVLHLSRNFGHQAAVQAGLAHATGNVVLLMDSDMQDAPEVLPQFLQQWQAGYDVVYAIRSHRKETWPKRFLFAAFHRTMAMLSDTPMPIDAGNFSLMDARVVREIVRLAERDRYLPGLRSWVGFRQTGVEVGRQARYDGRPRVSLRGLFRLAKTAIFSFSTFPLFVFSLIGFGASTVFLGLSGYSLFCRLLTDRAVPGWTSMVLVGSFFGAINALGISMLGAYVARIYDQVRGRPMYLVERQVDTLPSAEAGSNSTDQTCGSARADDDAVYRRLLADSTELIALGRGSRQTTPEPVAGSSLNGY